MSVRSPPLGTTISSARAAGEYLLLGGACVEHGLLLVRHPKIVNATYARGVEIPLRDSTDPADSGRGASRDFDPKQTFASIFRPRSRSIFWRSRLRAWLQCRIPLFADA